MDDLLYMSKTFEIEKIYFSISEVAEMFEVNASLLRFWEKEFPQLQPRKNSKGNRIYTKKDIELFKRIHELVRVKGFTLEGAKNALRVKGDESESSDIQTKLIRIRSELISISSGL
jgi:DNA-binding transcriptional MerR regulator